MKNIMVLLSALLAFAAPALAQSGAPSAVSVQYARQVASACLGAWQTPACLSVLSSSNFAMAEEYGTRLQGLGQEPAARNMGEHCAASTAAREKTYPADAMRSAFVECANTIADTAQTTNTGPDAGLYQLLVGAVMCLNNDRGCPTVEYGLKSYKN